MMSTTSITLFIKHLDNNTQNIDGSICLFQTTSFATFVVSIHLNIKPP